MNLKHAMPPLFVSNNFIPFETNSWYRCWKHFMTAHLSSGCRKNRRTWGRGHIYASGLANVCLDASHFLESRARLRPARRPARPTATKKNSANCSTRLLPDSAREPTSEAHRRSLMPIELKMPEVGESITEVEIVDWIKSEGDSVAKDENVVSIESEKASVDLPAPIKGKLVKILKRKGERARVGEVIGQFEESA